MNTKILIVEDDRMLNEGIAYALRKKEYLVYSAGTLEEAETYLNQSVNLVILDINLPDGDGREFLKKVRGNNPVPVLLCRIEVLLKHVGNMEGQFYYCGTLAYDFKEKLLRKGENFVKLTATEIRLLEVFLKHRNQVLTREQLLGLVWDAYENYVDEKTLNVNIRRLREKIEDDPKEPVYIKTVFGIGYKWSDKV